MAQVLSSLILRGERTWAIAMQTVVRESKFRTEFPCFIFLRKNGLDSEERRIYTNPPLTAMAQVLPFLIFASTELEPGNARGALLQTPAPVLDIIFGPWVQDFIRTGLGSAPS